MVRLHGYAPQSTEGKDRQRPIEQQESYLWPPSFAEALQIAALLPNARSISEADREAGLFERLDFRRCQSGRKADLLIRAKTDRCLEETEGNLSEELAAAPLAKTVSITVPRQREKLSNPSRPGRPALPARAVQVEIRHKQVTLSAPNTAQTRNFAPLTLWAIYLVEKHPPAGATPVAWFRLTTINVSSARQALKCIRWYCRR